ncbi:hypothetical protein [Sporosarcina sp. SAFN-010]|uniref:hypothetical protein n=1 Tax=Sporosarcina sp. SAFN-010 TaxID=3387273 RepID=UPI003F7DAEE5
MSKNIIEEIALEETRKVFSEFKDTKPTYISDLASDATDKVLYSLGSNFIESESRIREEFVIHLTGIKKDLGLK